MFGLSWGQIAIIVLVAVFLLGPERIPTAVSWVMSTLRKLRTMAAGAQAELRKEIGPELEELRRQVAELQSLKEVQQLRELRDLHPKRIIGKNILGDEFSGGIGGFLGLNGTNQPGDQPANGAAPDAGADRERGRGHVLLAGGERRTGGERRPVANAGGPASRRRTRAGEAPGAGQAADGAAAEAATNQATAPPATNGATAAPAPNGAAEPPGQVQAGASPPRRRPPRPPRGPPPSRRAHRRRSTSTAPESARGAACPAAGR